MDVGIGSLHPKLTFVQTLALKRAGVTDVISVSAVGSLRENLRPGMFVIVDQFIF
jgi:purine nucleoside phosphorylase